MTQPDAAAHAKLDRLLAASERHATLLNDIEGVLTQVLQAIGALAGAVGQVREAVVQLAQAAAKDSGGDDLGAVLRGILDELALQTGHMATISTGIERLPGLMEDTARAAAEQAARPPRPDQ
jgi:hypothetical protein